MSKKYILFSFLVGLLFACGEKNESSEEQVNSNEWELVILDSIQVDVLGTISTGDFRNGVGLLFDYTSNRLIKIDYEGNVISSKTYPKEGPNSINGISTVKIDSLGNPYIMNYRGDIYELNEDLSFKRKIEMPFPSTSYGGLMDNKSMEFWKNEIILQYAGRDEISPYIPNYLRDNFLLEKLNPIIGESTPLVKAPNTSKFSSDLLYERPTVSFTIQQNELLLYFNNEPKIHLFDLLEGGAFKETIELDIPEFLEAPELKDQYERYNYERLVEGNIYGIFSDQNLIVTHYSTGVAEDIFLSNKFNKPENFPKLIEYNDFFFKIYDREKGWSNKIPIPKKVDNIFAMESPIQPFFALRNDEYLGEEQDYITFYKLQLVKK